MALVILVACDKSDGEPEILMNEIGKGSSQSDDNQLISDLYIEIVSLSTSYTCSNENDWKYTALGSKACGGPTGYIAYSKKLDVDAFLAKVAFYTRQQDLYNKKWGIISDCTIPPEPKAVTCNDGEAVLEY